MSEQEQVGAGTPLAEALADHPALATLLAFRQIPTAACCTGVVPANLGEHLAAFGVQDVEGFIGWLNDFLRSSEHPAQYLKRWRAQRKAEGHEEKAQAPTFFLGCGCDSGS